jgi:hypothetical protein
VRDSNQVRYFMLSLLPTFSLAQVLPLPTPTFTPTPTPVLAREIVVQPQEMRPLPGQLDKVLMFNSNSPEVVQTEGILLSTFPPNGKAVPSAHLNFPFVGTFNLFAHHIARGSKPNDWRPMFLGVIVHNPGVRPVTLDILQAVSYATNPDAPFVELPSQVDNPSGKVYSGPGSRAMNDILRGVHHFDFPSQLVIQPRQSQMLVNLPIFLGNARTTFVRLRSSEPVFMASLAMPAPLNPSPDIDYDPEEIFSLLSPPPLPYRAPTLEEWQKLLISGKLAGPRDRPPTLPSRTDSEIVYGRVAGVAQGSEWRTEILDSPSARVLNIPERGKAFSYPISTINMVTLGTDQVQSAPLLVRYPDTAYRAHGNYAVHYSLTLPLINNTKEPQTVVVSIQTPLKQEDRLNRNGLRFLKPPDQQVFFRGTVQISYSDEKGLPKTRYVHLVQRRGQEGEPLVQLDMKPRDRRLVKVDFLYPPDALPPQVLTIRTLERSPD